ncbi:hypothetical protein Tco_1437254 [Tanacetum coccineum]
MRSLHSAVGLMAFYKSPTQRSRARVVGEELFPHAAWHHLISPRGNPTRPLTRPDPAADPARSLFRLWFTVYHVTWHHSGGDTWPTNDWMSGGWQVLGEPEGSNDFMKVPFDDEQILRQHNTAHVTPPPLAYTLTLPVLATMEPLDTFLMGDEVISTIPERENNELIRSSVDDLVPILRESELTLDSTDLECSMHVDPPLPCTDVLGDAIVDIDLPLGEHLDTLSMGDREIDFNPIRDIEELERLLADDLVPVLRMFDAPLGNSDSIYRSYDVTFSNPLFDFNDDYTLCYDNPLFDEEFEDISSLDLLSRLQLLMSLPC